MNKILKILGAAGAAAVVAACVPYHFENDKETGRMEIGGLLWNLTKTAGKEEDTYVMELLPFIGKENEEDTAETTIEVEIKDDDAAEEAPAEEEAVEEPFAAEEEPEVVVESVDSAAEATEEPFAEEAEVEVKVEEAE